MYEFRFLEKLSSSEVKNSIVIRLISSCRIAIRSRCGLFMCVQVVKSIVVSVRVFKARVTWFSVGFDSILFFSNSRASFKPFEFKVLIEKKIKRNCADLF